MAESNYCPNCGAQLFDDVVKCEYCDHDLRPKKKASQTFDEGLKDIGDTAQNLVDDITNNKDFNVVLFIILLMVFWPAGVIYLIAMQNKK